MNESDSENIPCDVPHRYDFTLHNQDNQYAYIIGGRKFLNYWDTYDTCYRFDILN